MTRILYSLSIALLISGTAWAATGLEQERPSFGARAGIVILAALQR